MQEREKPKRCKIYAETFLIVEDSSTTIRCSGRISTKCDAISKNSRCRFALNITTAIILSICKRCSLCYLHPFQSDIITASLHDSTFCVFAISQNSGAFQR